MDLHDVTGHWRQHWGEELTYPEDLMFTTLRMMDDPRPQPRLRAGPWRIIDETMVLGSGIDCHLRASERLLMWRAHRFAGVGVGAWRPATVGDVIRVRFAGTDSPCLILCANVEETTTRLVYGSLPGHVESGEEAFAVELGEDGTVRGRITAFSVHAWWLARAGAPVARAVQSLITRRYLRGMIP
ncbi:DUF1990 domain-containing protein [Corynebacterium sp. CCM 9185]|uniref:DUF1990 domain-containing protein n=1 Tax=Corynebacterium marambiense TaxID=2765364 RepID=A0ABS0VUP0_9CORY|nr:DUF1990 domain-containing protein [Corynebacterium marambiense]MBI9000490.1 DUF1990 domain-containing protein [Corynebacterium marambiense]MCK7664243.1 DUF1990 domain-containing protein [Corynebacterium marambiense]MCX7543449.1 DUF1990 domain-containing protein [Corynebacterium marambiense]